MTFAAYYLACVLNTGAPPPIEITVTNKSYGNTMPTHILRREWGETQWTSPLGAVIFWDPATDQLKLKVSPTSTAYPLLIGDNFDYDGEFTGWAEVTDWGMWRADQWAVPVLHGFLVGMAIDCVVAPIIILLRIGTGRALIKSD